MVALCVYTIYTDIFLHGFLREYVFAFVHVKLNMHMCIYLSIECVYIHISVITQVYACVCIDGCIHIRICIFTYTRTFVVRGYIYTYIHARLRRSG